MKTTATTKGIGLIEAIVALSIISAALTGAVFAHRRFVAVALQNSSRIKAAYLAEEGIEVARYLRDTGWTAYIATLANGVAYHLVFATTTASWIATTSVQTIDADFTRTITFEPVYRRTLDQDIVASTSPNPKSIDPNIRKVTTRVTATGLRDTELSTYLSDLFEN